MGWKEVEPSNRKLMAEHRFDFRWYDAAYYPLIAVIAIYVVVRLLDGDTPRAIYLLSIELVLALVMEFRRYKRRARHYHQTQIDPMKM